ncbi:MAG: TolC family protein [Pirellulaceae bacterium]|nr:TolC family protein [Pirellulaceae bacterium]
MSRSLVRYTAYLQIVLVLLTGCAPTQPFFIPKDNSMAHYLDQALAIEYADVQVESLPEASQAHQPLGPANAEREFVDLTLEDAVSMALKNHKILPVSNGANAQTGEVSALILSAQPGQLPSVYDAALVSTIASTQPLQVDNQGNRVPFRGAVRSNQVGGVEDALSEFDAQFSSIFGYNTTDRPRNVGANNPFNPQLFQAIDANYQSAISKRMATGGVATARVSTVYSYNNVEVNGPGRAVATDYTQALEFQLTHPLLRGRGTLVNRIPIVLARINEDIAVHDFEANVRNLVKATEDAYWDLYCGYRIVESAQQSLDTATYLWRVAADRAKAGGPPEAEAQARGLWGTFLNAMMAAKHGSPVPGSFDPRGLLGREQILREKIGWSPTDGRLIRPVDLPTEARVDFDWCNVLGEALVRNVELRKQKWAIKSIELEIMSSKNQLLPQLDATGIYRILGVGDVLGKTERTGLQFPAQGSSALESLTDGNFQEIGARLEFTPAAVGSRRPLAGIKNRQFALAKSHEELRQKELSLANQLSYAWRNIDSTYEQMRILRDQWAANAEEIKVYRDKIENNSGELPPLLDLLLRAEERRAQAQRSYYQAVCEYNKSIISIHYWKGSLLDLNSIALEEGPWPAKAYWDADELAKQRAAGHYFDYGYTRPAVVTRGHVESGMPTEGNVPTGGDTLGRDNHGTPTPADAQESDKDDKDEPKSEFPDLDKLEKPRVPEQVQPKAGDTRASAPRRQPSAGRNQDKQARAANTQAGEAFEWGEMDMEPAPVVSASAQRRAATPGQANSAPRNSAPANAAPQWRSKSNGR